MRDRAERQGKGLQVQDEYPRASTYLSTEPNDYFWYNVAPKRLSDFIIRVQLFFETLGLLSNVVGELVGSTRQGGDDTLSR